jgi:tetratricopeptide (TPR) repeat protein
LNFPDRENEAAGRAPLFPEYGRGGDYAGARRSRRAFRYSVLALIFFTFVLWYSENYLRFSLNESQYRMALTLPADSARAVLRNVVKRDAVQSEVPSARYVEALARIEESDLVLERYEEALKLNPSNPSLIINYGCRLFLAGRYREARERFREASIQDSRNALPGYLAAAALAAQAGGKEDLSEAMALVARTNSAGDPVRFPQPLWHPSLPEQGAWYARKARHIADQCCAPLYRFRHVVTARAAESIDDWQIQNWDSWLEKLQTMGEHLAGEMGTDAENCGVSQAICGIRIQLDAIEQRKRISQITHGAPDEAFFERTFRLESALDRLGAFEEQRDDRIRRHEAQLRRPVNLCKETFFIIFAVYLFTLIGGRIINAGRGAWTVPHARAIVVLLPATLLILLALLMIFSALPHSSAAASWLTGLSRCWYAVIAFLFAAGIVYPVFALPGARHVCERTASEEESDALLPAARRSRRIAALALMRRYFGLLLGGFICVFCLWVVFFRIGHTLYPWQYTLLVTGLEAEELALIREVQRMLTQAPALARIVSGGFPLAVLFS